MSEPRETSKGFLRTPLFSPKGFIIRAVIISVVFLICHLAGWRDNTAFLSGTSSVGRADLSVLLGVTYLVAYFGFVLAVPILLLGACAFAFLQRLLPVQNEAKTTGS